jgi:hypothetical protein
MSISGAVLANPENACIEIGVSLESHSHGALDAVRDNSASVCLDLRCCDSALQCPSARYVSIHFWFAGGMQAYVHSLAEEMDERIQGYAGISNPIGTATILTYSVCVEVPEADARIAPQYFYMYEVGTVLGTPALLAGPHYSRDLIRH